MGKTDKLREEVYAHREQIFRVCLKMLRRTDSPYDEATDMTADTMRNAIRGLESFHGESQLETWLHSIAVNLCNSRLLKIAKQQNHELRSLDEPLTLETGDISLLDVLPAYSGTDPLKALLVQSRRKMVLHAIESIGISHLRHATVLLARDIEQKSYAEIAEENNMSVQAIKTVIHRARQKLKVRLATAFANGEL